MPADVQRHFSSFFSKTVVANADVFLVSTEEEHNEFMKQLARDRGNFTRGGNTPPVQSCLSRSSYKHFCAFKKMFEHGMLRDEVSSACFVGDISQNPDQRARCGDILPAQCSSSNFYSFSKNRFFTSADMLASQGWPLAADFQDLVFTNRSALTTGQEKNLIGNGMHLAQVGLVFIYIMSFCLRKDDALAMFAVERPMSSSATDSGEGEDIS